MATLQNSAIRLKFGGLGPHLAAIVLYVLPLLRYYAFCMWVHEMRIQASSAERDNLLLCPFTVHRHCNWSQN